MVTLFCIRPRGYNIGNDAIFVAMQHFITEAFQGVVNLISLPATSRYESFTKAGLSGSTVYEINQYGDGVIIGGGNLYENGELEVNLSSLESLEVPMMLFSLSRGRIFNRQLRLVDRTDAMATDVVRALHRKASLSLPRDKATYDYLRRIGCHDIRLGGCPTIFLDRIMSRLPKIPEGDQGGVLISVRNPSLMSIPLCKRNKVYDDVFRLAEMASGLGMGGVRLLCHDYRDLPFAASFSGLEYVYAGEVHHFLALLKACSLNITYRLHSFLPCLAFGTPVVNISYDERSLSLVDTVGFDHWNINMLAVEDVPTAVADRLGRQEDLRQTRERAAPLWQDLYQGMSEAFAQFASQVKAYHREVNGNA